MTNGMDVTIDLGSTQSVYSVNARFMQSIGPWIWFPKEVVIAVSDDNKMFTELSRIKNSVSEKEAWNAVPEFRMAGSCKRSIHPLQSHSERNKRRLGFSR